MSYILVEFICPACGRFESLESRPPPAKAECGCGQVAARTISAVRHKTQWATAATRAKSDPPPAPTALNTIPLAEGMPKSQWRAHRKKVWQERDRAVRKAKGAPV